MGFPEVLLHKASEIKGSPAMDALKYSRSKTLTVSLESRASAMTSIRDQVAMATILRPIHWETADSVDLEAIFNWVVMVFSYPFRVPFALWYGFIYCGKIGKTNC